MSVIPLLASFYVIANYAIPKTGMRIDILIFLIISVVIAILGFFLIKDIFDRVITMAGQVK